MKQNANKLELTRAYDAPLKLVWDAWTDPEQIAQWWGPRGFTLTTKSKDFRVGGKWIYTMHGPDGTDYPNITTYHEIIEGKKLVYDHGGDETRPKLFTVTVLFHEEKGKTIMQMTMEVDTTEMATEMKKFIRQAGGTATWDRLAEFLEQEKSGKEKFVINRTFEAPLDVVFDAWTKPEHFAKWIPPTGMTMKFLRADIKVGGGTFYAMTNGADLTMYGRAEYLEIDRPHKIVYTQQFCDENEKVARHPMAPTWPETMLSTVQFYSEGPNETRVTVTWEVHGPATPAELATFVKERGGMTQGWTGSFDKLEDFLTMLNH